MESNYNNRDFEQFVKQNADQYRMFPSEKVWKGIHNTLHTRRRWYGIAFALLLLSSGVVTWVMLSPSGKNQQVSGKPAIISQNNNVTVSEKKIQQPNLLSPFAQSTKASIPFITNSDDQQKDIFSPDIASNLTDDYENIATTVSQNKTEVIAEAIPAYNKEKETNIFKPINVRITEQVIDNNPDIDLSKNIETTMTGNKFAEKKDIYPLSIESVVNSFKHITNRKKLLWKVYFAPTISYRKLTENKAFLSSSRSNNSIYSYAALYDINSVVTHKPDIGLELGFNAGYPIGKKLKIIAGLQLNVSKYDIKAVTYSSEVATIALNSGSGTNSVSTMTTYRNFDGNKPDWLHNLYISASAPIGAELKLKGNKNTYLGVGGTIQPTYILGDRAYLISTDYKNYAEMPSLIRKWNISTSFETFAGYSTGKIKWKVGPQVRYQMRSSFLEKYPFKEYLFDFGLKVGIMLNK